MQREPEATLADMLACREERAARQRAFLAAYRAPLVSFSLNIPGPVKTTPAIRRLFDDGLAAIRRALAALGTKVLASEEKHAVTGDECLLAALGEASAIKDAMVRLEETHPAGRLFDIDVLTITGEKLARGIPRRCLLCDDPAAACARSRRHSLKELTDRVQAILRMTDSRSE